MSVNGRKGAAFEQALVDYAVAHGHPRVERRVKNGNKDRGDIAGFPNWAVEAKAETTRDVPAAIREAKVEAENAGVTCFVAIHKYRNHSIAESMVTMPYWLWLELVEPAT